MALLWVLNLVGGSDTAQWVSTYTKTICVETHLEANHWTLEDLDDWTFDIGFTPGI
jgi:hypothetical protein